MIIPFKKHHLDMLKPQDTQASEFEFTKKSGDILEQHYSFSLLENSEILACGGIIPYFEGVGDVWIVFGEDKPQGRKTIYKALKWHLDYALSELGYHRLQTLVNINNDKAIRYIEHLGFISEGVMKKVYMKRDHIRYARVLED